MTALLSAAAPDDVASVAALLRAGQIAALPTETVYGLAGDARNEEAIAAIYTAKGRPSDNPLIVHVPSLEAAAEVVVEIPDAARELATRFWPGPLSMVLPRRPEIPNSVTAGLDTMAIRVPNHPAFLEVLRLADVPLAAPSANRAGSPSPTTAQHVLDDLGGLIPAVLDGGPCTVGVESTVVSLVGRPRLLRPGGVTLEQLRDVLGEVDVDPAITAPVTGDFTPGSPGMKYRHYAPAAPTVILQGDVASAGAYVSGRPGSVVLCPVEERSAFPNAIVYGCLERPETLAHGLFGALREADQPHTREVFIRLPEGTDGINLAIANRLRKAAGFMEIAA